MPTFGSARGYPFTDELHKWLIETYLADTRDAINDNTGSGTDK